MQRAAVLQRIVEQARRDDRVAALILFGSTARGEAVPRDLDVCLVLKEPFDRHAAAALRVEYLANSDADIQVFQTLPLPVRSRVLKEGEVLLANDEEALYEIAAWTIRASSYFQRAYRTYLEGVAAGS